MYRIMEKEQRGGEGGRERLSKLVSPFFWKLSHVISWHHCARHSKKTQFQPKIKPIWSFSPSFSRSLSSSFSPSLYSTSHSLYFYLFCPFSLSSPLPLSLSPPQFLHFSDKLYPLLTPTRSVSFHSIQFLWHRLTLTLRPPSSLDRICDTAWEMAMWRG